MIKSLISIVMSALMTFTGLSALSASDIRDTLSEMLFGIPASEDACSAGFLDSIEDSSIRALSEGCGFVKEKMILLMNPQCNVIKKYAFLKANGLTAVGWCTAADIFVVSCPEDVLSDIIAKCASLEKNEEVLRAFPLTVTKDSETGTPDDPFDFKEGSSAVKWDELSPSGANWWQEAVYARQAWDYSDYFGSVKIGITDGGFQTDHPELQGKISFPKKYQEWRNSTDDHGTHVAGIIAAEADNGIGLAGICQTASLTCTDWEPEGNQMWNTTLAVVFGFVLNVKAGAKALNFSMGMSTSIDENGNSLGDGLYYGSAALTSYAMASLLKKGYDFTVIHSAGNGNSAGQSVDARCSGYFAAINEDTCYTGLYKVSYNDIINRIIVVGSAKNNGKGRYEQAMTSNSGPEVSVAAPGVRIYSCISGSGYDYYSGTSMAAPIVTGIAGLIWSVNSSFTGAQVKNIIMSCTDNTAAVSSLSNYIGNYEERALPFVNAKLCVEEALKETYGNMGTVTGSAEISEKESTLVNFAGKSYTVLSDGSFSFVAEAGEGDITVSDSTGVIYTGYLKLEAGESAEVTLTPVQSAEPETIPEA